MIFVDKPFRIGDWITCGDIDGTVEEIGFRSTRVRTFRDSLIYVPNARMADSMIDNHGRRIYRRYYAKLCVSYETPPGNIETFVSGLREILQAHPLSRKDVHEIHLHEFARWGIVVMFYVFVKVPSWSEELRVRHELNINILRLAKQLDIRFVYGIDVPLSTHSLQEHSGFGKSEHSLMREKDREASRSKPKK